MIPDDSEEFKRWMEHRRRRSELFLEKMKQWTAKFEAETQARRAAELGDYQFDPAHLAGDEVDKLELALKYLKYDQFTARKSLKQLRHLATRSFNPKLDIAILGTLARWEVDEGDGPYLKRALNICQDPNVDPNVREDAAWVMMDLLCQAVKIGEWGCTTKEEWNASVQEQVVDRAIALAKEKLGER